MLPHLGLVVVQGLPAAGHEALVEAPLVNVGKVLAVVHLAGHPVEAVATMVVVPEVLTFKEEDFD